MCPLLLIVVIKYSPGQSGPHSTTEMEVLEDISSVRMCLSSENMLVIGLVLCIKLQQANSSSALSRAQLAQLL